MDKLILDEPSEIVSLFNEEAYFSFLKDLMEEIIMDKLSPDEIKIIKKLIHNNNFLDWASESGPYNSEKIKLGLQTLIDKSNLNWLKIGTISELINKYENTDLFDPCKKNMEVYLKRKDAYKKGIEKLLKRL